MKRMIIASNWKMNLNRQSASALLKAMAGEAVDSAVKRLVFPSFTLLESARQVIGQSGIELGGQDCHHEGKGAHTGDISAEMLIDAGCSWVLLGHSERRQNHNESGEIIAKKFAAAEAAGLSVMLCVGENRTERENGKAVESVLKMLKSSKPSKTDANFAIAYEPVWAIGSGKTPNPDDITTMHSALHNALGAGVAVLYGGSANAENAAELMALDGVDGLLIGGASLDADAISAISKLAMR